MSQNHIGLLGGTFDPVHKGHLDVADFVAGELGMSHVKLVTAARPPHKLSGVLAAEARHEMVEAAVVGRAGLEACRLELDHGISYTIDLVKHLIGQHPAGSDIRYSFITSVEYLNPDNPSNLTTWKGVGELLSLIEMVVTTRGSMGVALAEKWAAQLKLPNIRIIEIPVIAVSSGVVKDALRSGASIDHLVPSGVAELIRERGHYRGIR